ncbi:FecR family protein [Elongatibacter sediminis]|uniref:FecR domain-containing protein n=1 Tax=Elongatibacter sediminis TaxID=3119006 RepID=A0AAW9REV4_9GAMM
MSMIRFTRKIEIQEQASEWVIRLENSDLSQSDVDEFLAWLDRGPHHRKEFYELISVWEGLESLSNLADIIPLDDLREPHPRQVRFGWIPARMASATGAVALLGVVAVAVLLASLTGHDSVPREQVYRTEVGEFHTTRLADGSTLHLNTNTRLRVDYSDAFRRIYLDRGEVYFDVARDAQRPFVVNVAKGSITAVGTAFNIQYENEIVDVTVTDGIVEVNTSAASELPILTPPRQDRLVREPTKTSLQAGQKLEFDASGIRTIDHMDSEAVDQQLSWQRGVLIFDGDPLEDVVNEMSRYTATKIRIEDPEIRQLQIGGYFRTGEIDAMLDALESSFDLTVTRIDQNEVIISRSDAGDGSGSTFR